MGNLIFFSLEINEINWENTKVNTIDRPKIPVLKQNNAWYFSFVVLYWPSKQNFMKGKMWIFA